MRTRFDILPSFDLPIFVPTQMCTPYTERVLHGIVRRDTGTTGLTPKTSLVWAVGNGVGV